MHLEVSPDDLPGLIQAIEEELQKSPKIILPRATAIADKIKIAELDQKLVQEILNSTNAGLQPAEATVSGVDFVFLGKNQYRFIFDRQGQDIEGELNLSALHDFIKRHNIDLATSINEIKIKVSDEHNKGYTKPLKYYVDDERHFLRDGGWHVFNQNYIDFLKKQIDDRITFENPNINFSNSVFEQWRNGLSEEERVAHGYAEYHFNSLRENDGYLNLDRHITILKSVLRKSLPMQ